MNGEASAATAGTAVVGRKSGLSGVGGKKVNGVASSSASSSRILICIGTDYFMVFVFMTTLDALTL